MLHPAREDTIVAVSTAWQAAPLGIVRLSGPDAFALVDRLRATVVVDGPAGEAVAARPTGRSAHWTDVRLCLAEEVTIPAVLMRFAAPHSYTGQDVAELHVPGGLPLLRTLAGRLLELGARRALPGEFTARAFLGGKLDADQVEQVLALLCARHAAAARQAARATPDSSRRVAASVAERLLGLLARVEAGIDFVDEEDVQFVAPPELVQTLDAVLDALDADADPCSAPGAAQPHVALVGLPNAGKSTLFNALVGSERAIVSPVLGTTRDVLSAAVTLGERSVVLQDCAGLGASADELECATHLAAEAAAERADLVLLVHAADEPWTPREAQLCARLGPGRVLRVWSKCDLRGAEQPGEVTPAGAEGPDLHVSAISGAGLTELRSVLHRRVESAGGGGLPHGGPPPAVTHALRRARALAAASLTRLDTPELIAFELRAACEDLDRQARAPLDDEILARIYSQFCVGK